MPGWGILGAVSIRIACALFTLWIAIPPSVCQAACAHEASASPVAEAAPTQPGCHGDRSDAPPESSDDAAYCAAADVFAARSAADPAAASAAVPVSSSPVTEPARRALPAAAPAAPHPDPYAQSNPPLLN